MAPLTLCRRGRKHRIKGLCVGDHFIPLMSSDRQLCKDASKGLNVFVTARRKVKLQSLNRQPQAVQGL